MMRRRRGGVGLLGVAAVAGVAHHAGTKSAQAQAQEEAQNQQIADLQAQQAGTRLRRPTLRLPRRHQLRLPRLRPPMT